MAKFRFAMQNILDIKQKLEEQAKANYGIANRKYQEEQMKLQQLLIRRVGYEKQLKESMLGNLEVKKITNYRSDLSAIKTMIHRQMLQVHKAEAELEDARRKLNEIMQERKTYEKLREKAFIDFLNEMRAAESKEIDELVSYSYNNKEEE